MFSNLGSSKKKRRNSECIIDNFKSFGFQEKLQQELEVKGNVQNKNVGFESRKLQINESIQINGSNKLNSSKLKELNNSSAPQADPNPLNIPITEIKNGTSTTGSQNKELFTGSMMIGLASYFEMYGTEVPKLKSISYCIRDCRMILFDESGIFMNTNEEITKDTLKYLGKINLNNEGVKSLLNCETEEELAENIIKFKRMNNKSTYLNRRRQPALDIGFENMIKLIPKNNTKSISDTNSDEQSGNFAFNLVKPSNTFFKCFKCSQKSNSHAQRSFLAYKYPAFMDTSPYDRSFEIENLNIKFKDHIVIIAETGAFVEQLISKIRIHNLERPIVLLIEKIEEHTERGLLYSFINFFIIKGEISLFTFSSLNFQKAFFVVVSARKTQNCFDEDSLPLLTSKILDEYFQVNYIVEIESAESLKFLSQTYYSSKEISKKDFFFNSSFFGGKAFFENTLSNFFVHSKFNLDEAMCIKELIENDYQLLYSKFDEISNIRPRKNFTQNMTHEISITSGKYQPWINSLELSSSNGFSYAGRTYQDLVNDLLEMSLIPLGVYVYPDEEDMIELENEVSEGKKLSTEEKLRLYSCIIKNNKIPCDKTDLEYWSHPIFLTNPPASTLLPHLIVVTYIGKYNYKLGENSTQELWKVFAKQNTLASDIENQTKSIDKVRVFLDVLEDKLKRKKQG